MLQQSTTNFLGANKNNYKILPKKYKLQKQTQMEIKATDKYNSDLKTKQNKNLTGWAQQCNGNDRGQNY